MELASRHFTIRTRLLALVVAATLPLAALVVALGVAEYRHARQVAADRVSAASRVLAERLESDLSHVDTVLGRVAARGSVRAMDAGRCDPVLRDYLELHPRFAAFELRDGDGRVVCAARASGAPPLAIVDPAAIPSGDALAVSGALRTAQGAWVAVFTHPVAGERSRGRLDLTVSLDTLAHRLAASVPEGILVALLDREGRYLVRSQRGAEYVGDRLAPRLAAAFTESPAGRFEADGPDGIARQYAWTVLPRTGWRIVAGLDEEAIVAASRNLLIASVAGFTAFLALVYFVTFRLGLTIAEPIQELARAAARLADGDEAARAPPAPLREIDEVGRQLNRMVEGQAVQREALRASEQRFRDLVENVPNIAVQGYDRSRRVTFWNAASERLYGWTAAEAIGQPLEALIIPEAMREAVVEGHAAWVAGGPPIPPGELVLRHKDGSPVPVFSSHEMRTGLGGEPEMYCIDIDLTPLKRAEREVGRWRERYRAAIVASGQLIHEWESATDALAVFGDTRRILGYEAEELADVARWRALIHPEDLPRFEAEAARSHGTGTPFHLEYRVRRRDGEWLTVQDDGYFVRDAGGAIDCMVCFILDVTARHRADERSRAQLEELRRWHAAMLGREGRLLELKREVNALKARLGEPPRYPSAGIAEAG